MRLITIIQIIVMISGAIVFDITKYKLTGVLIVIIGVLFDDILKTDKEEQEKEEEDGDD